MQMRNSPVPLTVRPATLDDLEGIMEIERASFAAPWPKSCIQEEIENVAECSRLDVAERDGIIAGFMNYWHVEDERHLLNFAVHPRYRRGGVGKAMLACLLDAARADRARLVLLEVRFSNTAARSLYRSAGFQDFDLRKRYYSDNGEDAVVMICPLRDAAG
jgi:ribosomal-protein-alanine N-acetyltransferase